MIIWKKRKERSVDFDDNQFSISILRIRSKLILNVAHAWERKGNTKLQFWSSTLINVKKTTSQIVGCSSIELTWYTIPISIFLFIDFCQCNWTYCTFFMCLFRTQGFPFGFQTMSITKMIFHVRLKGKQFEEVFFLSFFEKFNERTRIKCPVMISMFIFVFDSSVHDDRELREEEFSLARLVESSFAVTIWISGERGAMVCSWIRCRHKSYRMQRIDYCYFREEFSLLDSDQLVHVWFEWDESISVEYVHSVWENRERQMCWEGK